VIVSKARFDLLQHNFDEARKLFRETVEDRDAQIAALRQERQELLGAVLELARPRHNTVAPLKPVERSKLAADRAIDDVVEARGGNAILRRQLQRYANLERQKGTPETKIAGSIRDWRDPDADEDAA
jgi:hypothetical protein